MTGNLQNFMMGTLQKYITGTLQLYNGQPPKLIKVFMTGTLQNYITDNLQNLYDGHSPKIYNTCNYQNLFVRQPLKSTGNLLKFYASQPLKFT